jgi:hypothetical protein
MDDYFDGRGGKLGLRAAPTSVLGRALERVPRGAPAAAAHPPPPPPPPPPRGAGGVWRVELPPQR